MTSLRGEVDAVAARAAVAVEDLRRYWLDTRTAWEIVEESTAPPGYAAEFFGGPAFASTPERRRDLAGRAERYAQTYLAASTVQQLYALFDGFLFGLIRAWLLAHPRHLLRTGRGQSERQVTLADIVRAPDRAAVIAAVVEREVRDRAYDPLDRQLDSLGKLFGADRPDAGERASLLELKATRDLVVHGDGRVGEDYLKKAGPLARFAAGERMQLPDVYLAASFDLVAAVVAGLAEVARAKAGAAPARG